MPTNEQMEKIRDLYKKYHEQIAYVFYGGLTTAVNFVTFGLLADVLHIDEMASQLIAWFASVVFAFFTSKFRVFDNAKSGRAFHEFLGFFGARLLSGVIENGGFWVFAEQMGFNSYLVKLALSVFVVLVNYGLSKFLIFRKK